MLTYFDETRPISRLPCSDRLNVAGLLVGQNSGVSLLCWVYQHPSPSQERSWYSSNPATTDRITMKFALIVTVQRGRLCVLDSCLICSQTVTHKVQSPDWQPVDVWWNTQMRSKVKYSWIAVERKSRCSVKLKFKRMQNKRQMLSSFLNVMLFQTSAWFSSSSVEHKKDILRKVPEWKSMVAKMVCYQRSSKYLLMCSAEERKSYRFVI